MSGFLLHTDKDGFKTLYSYQKDLPSGIDMTEVSEIDIPTDKEGLRNAFQEV